jgi:phosphotransferase system  glucose/maltose/N-acetylglucosamine-specific IIC component
MSNYAVVGDSLAGGFQSPRALPYLIAAGIAATAMLQSAGSQAEAARTAAASMRSQLSYVALHNPDTAVAGGQAIIDVLDGRFEGEITAFYDRLLKAQQPLGADFQAVLADNLWDLYAD